MNTSGPAPVSRATIQIRVKKARSSHSVYHPRFITSTTTPLVGPNYLNWAAGQPNNGGGCEWCAGFSTGPGWWDAPCTSKHHCLFEIETNYVFALKSMQTLFTKKQTLLFDAEILPLGGS